MPPETGGNGILSGRQIVSPERAQRTFEGPPDAFQLFASYYLGITPDDGYQKPNIEEIARRHSMTADDLRKLLVHYNLDAATMRKTTFDLQTAQLDIRLAPQGISRTESGRELFQWYCDTLEEAGIALPGPPPEMAPPPPEPEPAPEPAASLPPAVEADEEEVAEAEA